MRSKLEPWESGLLCELWEGVELRILDNPPRTQARLLRLVDDQLQLMRWKYRSTAENHVRKTQAEKQATSIGRTLRVRDTEARP